MLLLLLVGAFAALVAFYLHRTFSYWRRHNVPSYPSPSLIKGNAGNKFTDQVVLMYNYFKERGYKHGGFYLFHQPIYMPLDPDILKHILTKDFDHFTGKGLYMNDRDQPITTHLFSMGGERWKRLRVKLTPTFTSGKMRNMFPTILACSDPLVERMAELTASGQPVDIKDVASRFTTDVIGSCAFGIDCNSFRPEGSEFHRTGTKLLTPTPMMLFKRAMSLSFPNLCLALGMKVLPKEPNDFYTNVTAENLRYRLENDVHRNDFLQLLIELHRKENPAERISEQEIISQSFVFYIAGFETSSSLMTFALIEMSRNAAIQERVRKEIFAVLARHDNKVTYEAIGEMKYLGQVVDETLRMYPALLVLNRECTKDYAVPDTDVVLKAGTKVFVPVLGVHRDERNYPEPEKFDPERFSEENKHERHPYAWIPFGEGPRQCIGMRFGYLQAKIGLVTLLRRFRFELDASVRYPIVFNHTILALLPEDRIILKSTAL